MSESVDRRVLAGFVCRDAVTSSSIPDPLTVTAPDLVLRRNRSGIFAVMSVKGAPSLDALTDDFVAPTDPNAWPPPSSYEITIQDPASQYLPRRAKIAAPQPLPAALPPTATTTMAPSTTGQGSAASLPPVTTPQSVVLYPTTAAPPALNWAVVRVAVVNNATPPAPLQWAVIQVVSAGNPTATGITNDIGEAMLALPGLGLKLSSSSTGAVTESTTAAILNAWFDPTTLNQPKGWFSNPDDILLNLATPNPLWKSATQAIQLSPGETVQVNITISI
jgi:hypothetical protein